MEGDVRSRKSGQNQNVLERFKYYPKMKMHLKNVVHAKNENVENFLHTLHT